MQTQIRHIADPRQEKPTAFSLVYFLNQINHVLKKIDNVSFSVQY